jgi:hypothetical protein
VRFAFKAPFLVAPEVDISIADELPSLLHFKQTPITKW